jgi:hypothetical protein
MFNLFLLLHKSNLFTLSSGILIIENIAKLNWFWKCYVEVDDEAMKPSCMMSVSRNFPLKWQNNVFLSRWKSDRHWSFKITDWWTSKRALSDSMMSTNIVSKSYTISFCDSQIHCSWKTSFHDDTMIPDGSHGNIKRQFFEISIFTPRLFIFEYAHSH